MYKNKKDLLENILINYKGLFEILCKEGNGEVPYAINTIGRSIDYMEAVASGKEKDIEIYDMLRDIKKAYNSMYTPRDGFGEFFIWREKFDDRHEANLKLDKIKDELDEYFDSIN